MTNYKIAKLKDYIMTRCSYITATWQKWFIIAKIFI